MEKLQNEVQALREKLKDAERGKTIFRECWEEAKRNWEDAERKARMLGDDLRDKDKQLRSHQKDIKHMAIVLQKTKAELEQVNKIKEEAIAKVRKYEAARDRVGSKRSSYNISNPVRVCLCVMYLNKEGSNGRGGGEVMGLNKGGNN